MSLQPEPPRQPSLWEAWSAGQLTAFALLLLGAQMFWWAVVYQLSTSVFAATTVSTLLAVLLPCAVASWWHGETIWRAFQFRPHLVTILVGGAAGLLSWAPASLLAGFSSQLHPPSPEYLALVAETLPRTPLETALAYLAVTVAAPLGEELVFRGILFRLASDRWGWIRAAVLTGLFFGVAHWQPWNLFGLVALGLVLATLYHGTRSLLAPIVAHAVYNTVSLTVLLGRRTGDEIVLRAENDLTDWIVLVASTLLLVGLLVRLLRHASQLEAVSPPDEPS